jgi:hypothetical protein
MIKKFFYNYEKPYKGPFKFEDAKAILNEFLRTKRFIGGMITTFTGGFLKKRAKTNKYDVFIKVYQEKATCNICGKEAESEIEFEFIKENGICLGCDHVQGEVNSFLIY